MATNRPTTRYLAIALWTSIAAIPLAVGCVTVILLRRYFQHQRQALPEKLNKKMSRAETLFVDEVERRQALNEWRNRIGLLAERCRQRMPTPLRQGRLMWWSRLAALTGTCLAVALGNGPLPLIFPGTDVPESSWLRGFAFLFHRAIWVLIVIRLLRLPRLIQGMFSWSPRRSSRDYLADYVTAVFGVTKETKRTAIGALLNVSALLITSLFDPGLTSTFAQCALGVTLAAMLGWIVWANWTLLGVHEHGFLGHSAMIATILALSNMQLQADATVSLEPNFPLLIANALVAVVVALDPGLAQLAAWGAGPAKATPAP